MIQVCADREPPVTELYELVNEICDYDLFVNRCKEFSVLDKSVSDEAYLRFQLGEQLVLLVGVDSHCRDQTKLISCAVLSVCWWETYSKLDHTTLKAYSEERGCFEAVYERFLSVAISRIGKPTFQNRDNDERAYNYAIWRRKAGLLILQQSSYDPQFGHDINYWIQPWPADREIIPTVPFTDWLLNNVRKSR